MSLKIHVSSTKKAEILEFLKINKPILRAGAKVKPCVKCLTFY